VRGADGTEYVYDYGAASEFQLAMARVGIKNLNLASPQQLSALETELNEIQRRHVMTEEDTKRLVRPETESEAATGNRLKVLQNAVDNLLADFPNPAQRDQYVGLLNRPIAVISDLMSRDDQFARFVTDMKPFQSAELPVGFERDFRDLPTGFERTASEYEAGLFQLRHNLEMDNFLHQASLHMPAGADTTNYFNQVRQYYQQARANEVAAHGYAVYGPGGQHVPAGGERPPNVVITPPVYAPPAALVAPAAPRRPTRSYGYTVAQ
jgi:hypothetical protein